MFGSLVKKRSSYSSSQAVEVHLVRQEGGAGGEVELPVGDEMMDVLAFGKEEALDSNTLAFRLVEESLDMLSGDEHVGTSPYREKWLSNVYPLHEAKARLHELNRAWGDQVPKAHERGEGRREKRMNMRRAPPERGEDARQHRTARVGRSKTWRNMFGKSRRGIENGRAMLRTHFGRERLEERTQ